MKRTHFTAIIALTALTWAALTFYYGFPRDWVGAMKPFGSAITVTTTLFLFFNMFFWSWPIFRGWFVEIPDISGSWEIILRSSWINPETGEGVPPITAFGVFTQSFTALHFRLFTTESTSGSLAYSFTKTEGSSFELFAAYRNSPQIDLQNTRSKSHLGSFIVHVPSYRPDQMDGHYWTDRKTNGQITFTSRHKGVVTSYKDALTKFGNVS